MPTIPPVITAAEAYTLCTGRNVGKRLADLDDATLDAVRRYYESRDFYAWRLAHIAFCARYCRHAGLIELTPAQLTTEAQATTDPVRRAAAQWLVAMWNETDF